MVPIYFIRIPHNYLNFVLFYSLFCRSVNKHVLFGLRKVKYVRIHNNNYLFFKRIAADAKFYGKQLGIDYLDPKQSNF